MHTIRGCVLVAACAMPLAAHADTLTYSGVLVRVGSIDNVDLTGQTATISIEFASGLTASGGVYALGPISSATYEFSGAGAFTIDTPEDSLEFGSVNGFELSFFDDDLDPLGMLSGTFAGDIGLDPLEGETLPELFARLGDGSSIDFTQPADFQMLNSVIGTLNGGQSVVTTNIVGMENSNVTLTYVPTPGAAALMSIALLGAARRRR